EVNAFRREEEDAAIERPARALDDTNYEIGTVRAGDLAKTFHRRAGNVDRAFPVEAELLPPLRGARSHNRSESQSTWGGRNEGFGKEDEVGRLALSFARKVGDLLKRLSDIEDDGCRLDDRNDGFCQFQGALPGQWEELADAYSDLPPRR